MLSKKNSNSGQRAWNMLRLSLLLWSRKGGVFKKLMLDLKFLSKQFKNLGHINRRASINYGGEHELSFDETPIFHVKMHRPALLRFKMPRIPCLNQHPQVEVLDYNFQYECEDDRGHDMIVTYEEEGDEEIDVKAEEFIENFYKQMKLQRQISHLQYNN